MKNFMITLFLQIFVTFCFGSSLSLPAVFSSHMVLQQEMSVPFEAAPVRELLSG